VRLIHILLWFLFLLMLPSQVSAQFKISGYILNQDNHPISGVPVVIHRGAQVIRSEEAISRDNGYYEIHFSKGTKIEAFYGNSEWISSPIKNLSGMSNHVINKIVVYTQQSRFSSDDASEVVATLEYLRLNSSLFPQEIIKLAQVIKEESLPQDLRPSLHEFEATAKLIPTHMMDTPREYNSLDGGAAMYRNKDIVDSAVSSNDHTTLVAAIRAAGLVPSLKGKGPYTLFAPTNEAFEKLPTGTIDTLVKPENKATLIKLLTYHMIAGKYDSKKLMKLIKQGAGKAMLKTVSGGTLTARLDGNKIVLTDERGGASTITIADVYQSNGVIHVVDTVLMNGSVM
jgi:uncharacterized surface protein with fasciclin (FAS1) repeats